jgi:ParB-like chromosome segregation protein Spo0J
MEIRDRIKELRRVRAGDLRPNARNWRTHSDRQRDALRGLLAEIGYASALVARELADGSLELIDGHLRAETTPDAEVPVLIVDVDEREAAKLLATLDPLAGMAGKDEDLLAGLLRDVETDSAAVRAMLDEVGAAMGAAVVPRVSAAANSSPVESLVPAVFQVVVECRDEDQQREVYERMHGEGFSCRVVTL